MLEWDSTTLFLAEASAADHSNQKVIMKIEQLLKKMNFIRTSRLTLPVPIDTDYASVITSAYSEY